ncbi:MAG: energy transducer TonB [Acidobacteria bacterium]|nr:MAG: energy transducer TonB [Acidobacteriota bacterium]
MKRIVLTLALGLAVSPALVFAQSQMPIRVGGNVKAPDRIKYVAPKYPEIAASAQVQGIVILEAVVGPDGSVTDAKVLKSVALLDQAAVDAVREWKYEPTLLNGVPVPVIMTVTVNFSLAGGTSAGATMTPAQGAAMTAMSNNPPPTWNGKTAIRIGGDIKAPERVKYVPPVYPDDAQQAKVQGIVILECIIDEDGNIAQAKILKGVPLLDQAALDAVLLWKYTPTLLNGVAMPVVMTVTVNFTLTTR